MAKKPFEIQSADLIIGGVNLQAGTGSIVIPGVTQATNFQVDEVEDTDVDQNTQFVQLSIVVDAATYNALSNNASTAGYATYTVELDDDFYIDEIEVDDPGSYTQQEKTTNETTDMWAYTGLVDPFTTPFDQFDWLQVPFRPKMRAGAVENVGGGNANTGNVVFNGNQMYVGGTGFLNLENSDDQIEIGSNNLGPLKVSVNEGDKAWLFNIDGTLQLPAGGDVVDSNGDSVLGGGSNSYTPEDEDNWGTVPSNIQSALDELAARVTALQNYEIDGGNAYTPPQGETIIDGNGA